MNFVLRFLCIFGAALMAVDLFVWMQLHPMAFAAVCAVLGCAGLALSLDNN